MGVITHKDENTSPIPPARLFKALILDSHNLIPKVVPQVVKSIEIIQGDGGTGSIRQVTFAEGVQFGKVKNRIDEINEETYSYKYTVIEGDALADKLESATYEIQLEATPDGGTKSKMTSKYHTKGDSVITEEEIKAGKKQVLDIYKIVEGYLLQNPDAYA